MDLIRDLLAVNAALDDIKAVDHALPETIALVHKLYTGNTGLPLDQKTYGIEISKNVVASYFGLLQIGIIQREDEKSSAAICSICLLPVRALFIRNC